MSDINNSAQEDESSEADSKADAIAAFLLITITVCGLLYYISSQ
ncbi:hypothetical protein OAP18_03565 [Gammaproteobacteria bacterium]|nr:hypothetical protein [Gammaproteobacteria bacterium]